MTHKFNVGDVVSNPKYLGTNVEVVVTLPKRVVVSASVSSSGYVDMVVNISGVHALRDSSYYELAPKAPLFFEAEKKYRCTYGNGYHYDVEIVDVNEGWVIGWYLRNLSPFSWPSPNVPLGETWSEIK